MAIAVVKDARFRSIHLGKSEDHLRFLDYHGIPKPHAFSPDNTPIIPLKVFSLPLSNWQNVPLCEITPSLLGRSDPLLDILCNQFTREALQQLSTDGQKLISQKIQVAGLPTRKLTFSRPPALPGRKRSIHCTHS